MFLLLTRVHSYMLLAALPNDRCLLLIFISLYFLCILLMNSKALNIFSPTFPFAASAIDRDLRSRLQNLDVEFGQGSFRNLMEEMSESEPKVANLPTEGVDRKWYVHQYCSIMEQSGYINRQGLSDSKSQISSYSNSSRFHEQELEEKVKLLQVELDNANQRARAAHKKLSTAEAELTLLKQERQYSKLLGLKNQASCLLQRPVLKYSAEVGAGLAVPATFPLGGRDMVVNKAPPGSEEVTRVKYEALKAENERLRKKLEDSRNREESLKKILLKYDSELKEFGKKAIEFQEKTAVLLKVPDKNGVDEDEYFTPEGEFEGSVMSSDYDKKNYALASEFEVCAKKTRLPSVLLEAMAKAPPELLRELKAVSME